MKAGPVPSSLQHCKSGQSCAGLKVPGRRVGRTMPSAILHGSRARVKGQVSCLKRNTWGCAQAEPGLPTDIPGRAQSLPPHCADRPAGGARGLGTPPWHNLSPRKEGTGLRFSYMPPHLTLVWAEIQIPRAHGGRSGSSAWLSPPEADLGSCRSPRPGFSPWSGACAPCLAPWGFYRKSGHRQGTPHSATEPQTFLFLDAPEEPSCSPIPTHSP